MKSLILVFLGGGVGSILRYGVNLLLYKYSDRFPFHTLTANITSCIILGVFMALATKELLSNEAKMFLMIGLCGGFSTFSTFSSESFRLFETGSTLLGILYMGVSFMICLCAIFLGLQIGKLIWV